MPEHPDITRLRAEYAERARRPNTCDRYSLFYPPHLFLVQQRQRALLKLLRETGFFPLRERFILEVGCGKGGVLLETLGFGAAAGNLLGVDLLFDSLVNARQAFACLPLSNADGQYLPFAPQTFDLTMQFTVFSSAKDSEVKSRLAQEMIRVTRPGGMILWYDFWLNPTNPQTRGIGLGEIRKLFPNCSIRSEKITLAPPITRRLVSISWSLCLFLESLRIFNTHYLVRINPNLDS